jgi:hypothetical protein
MLYDTSTTSLLFKGKDIVARIKAQHNNIFTEIEKIINSIKMEYSEEEVFQALERFSRIRIDDQRAASKEARQEKHHEDCLLESEVDEATGGNYLPNINHTAQLSTFTHNTNQATFNQPLPAFTTTFT